MPPDGTCLSPSQTDALCAIVFLYDHALLEELGPQHRGDIHALRSRRPKTLPTDVLGMGEVRLLMLPAALREDLIEHLAARRYHYERDLQRYAGYVPLPDSVRHRAPTLDRGWAWQFCFVDATATPSSTARRMRGRITTGRSSDGDLNPIA